MNILKTTLPLLLVVMSLISCGAKTKEVKDESNNKEKTYAISLTKEEFRKKVVDYTANPEEWLFIADKPVIIDFWAEWCVYCRRLAPVLEKLAQEYDGEIYVYKVNTEEEREVAAAFGIRSLPTLLFIPLNKDPQVVQGAIPKKELKKVIDEFLLKESK